MSGVSLAITGEQQLYAELERYGAKATPAAAAALFEEAEDIMADSKENYVPVDVATLKNSGHVQRPDVSNDRISVTLAYGGAAEDYAVVQHERLDYRHTVGQAKYLERPLLKAVVGMAGRLAARIRGAFQ